MKPRNIKSPSMIDPFTPREFEAAVAEDGTIPTKWGVFSFREQDTSLPPGSVVIIYLSGGYYKALTKQEKTEMETEIATRAELERKRVAAETFERRKRDRIRSEEANRNIKLPVAWAPAIKDVLSGLSENRGDGRNKRTVQHILLKEDLKIGRLSRDRGNLLCGTDWKNWSQQPEEFWIDENGREYAPEVTCKACLDIAHRISKK